MKGICVTGVSPLDTARVAEILHQAGMQPAKPAGRDNAMGIALWHDEVMAAMAEDADGLQPIESPGRLWEQLASDIFLANMKSKVWGWADVRSTWLLNYWKDFEPRLKFVLVATAPETMLAHAIMVGEELADIDVIMSTWLTQQQELLRFYHRNTERCVLVDAQDCAVHPQALVQLCKKQWKLALDTGAAHAAETKATSPISQYLANKLCQGYPEVLGLQHEVAATLSHLATDADTPVDVAGAISVQALVADYRDLCHANAELLAQHEANALAHAEAMAQREALGKTQEETKQESELLLLQLHQVQEELETYFLKHQEAQGQLDAANAEVQALQNALQAQQHNAAHQVVAAVDVRAQETIAQLTDERNQLARERDAQTHARQEAAAGYHSALKQLEETKQESELLLLQLHQVQEELEHYFLQHQEVSQQKQAVEARLHKVLACYPDHVECDSIELIAQNNPPDTLRAKIHHLIVGPRNVGVFELAIETTGNKLVLVVKSRGQAVLADHTLQLPLRIDPAALSGSKAAAILAALAPADLQLIRAACLCLAQGLPNEVAQRTAWVQRLNTVRQQLAELPRVWRYDTVELKNQQINPGYEHLWFRLTNAQFGERHWPTFEFRLGAAGVERNGFSCMPRLEFPKVEGSAPQLECWFEETSDERGPKFELRFDTKNAAMDIGCWRALNVTDQAQVLSLLERMPIVLERLQAQGVSIARPWSEWLALISGIQHTMVQCLLGTAKA